MTSNFDWSQFEEVDSPNTVDWSQFEEEKKAPSRVRSLVSAPLKGILKSAKDINPLSPAGPLPEKLEEQLIERFLPTQKELPEQLLERAGKVLPYAAIGPEGIGAKVAQTAGGAISGQIGKELGLGEFGQSILEALGMGIPGLIKGGVEKAVSSIKAPSEKMASGLTKPRAIEAKLAKKGIITPTQQEKAITKLNEEAAKLTRQAVETKLPVSKQIEKGFDFEGTFEKGFGELQKTAARANPEIDITPISQLMSKTMKKYRGIPKLHPEAAKVVQEIRALSKRPQTSLHNLLKIYRSNNQKVKNIFETSRLTGRQQEYVDFLGDLNKGIVKSIEKTLPENSAWLNKFKDLNRDYKSYKHTQKVLSSLESIFGEKVDPKSLQKLAANPKQQQKLALSMGKEGAEQVTQIAKDLQEATKAIKRIPAKELSKWESVIPFTYLIPGMGKVVGTALTAAKVVPILRRLYGLFLITPARRKAYQKALKSISLNDLKGFTSAIKELERELRKRDEEPD